MSDSALDADTEQARALSLAQELHELGAMLAPPSTPPPASGQRWGRFEILHPLGRGGLSEVYLARDGKLGRQVALKRLRPHASLDERTRRWLANEGQSLARLKHPGVVGVLDLDTDGDDPLLVMEYVEGAPLSLVLAHLRGELSEHSHVQAAATVLEPIAARVDFARKAASALAHCHMSGVLHRDVKPANVVVDASFQPRLIDFGLAHLESVAADAEPSHLTEQLVGTPAYFAPEQIDATRIGADPRSDQFSFGVLLYELLSGRQPFVRPTREATLQAVGRAEFEPLRTVAPELAPELDWITQRCMERDPRERYASMDAVAADLDAFLHYRAVSAAPPSLVRQARRALRRNAATTAWLAVAATSALLVFVGRWIADAREARATATEELERMRRELAGIVDPTEYQETLIRLADIEHDEEMRGAQLAGVVAPPQTALVQEVIAAAADGLLAQIAFERQLGREQSRRFERASWRGALASLATLRPNDERIVSERDRERAFAPNVEGVEHRLERWSPAKPGADSVLVPITWSSYPGEGRYRWSAIERATGALLAEREFHIVSDGEPIHLELKPAVSFPWDSALVEVAPPPESGEATAADSTPVRVALRVICWRELEAVVAETHGPASEWRKCREVVKLRNAAEAAPEAPALVPHPVAELFAARVDARLPTRSELRAAFACAAVAPASNPVALEWLGDLGGINGNSGVLAYAKPGERAEFTAHPGFCTTSSEGQTAFRLARSAH